MLIEELITSKTRVKILKLFLSDIEHRYYLRELERKLDESLSPLRRQLVKLVRMGILEIEEEANLKYYRLNKNFHGLGELKKLLLGGGAIEQVSVGDSDNKASGRIGIERIVSVPVSPLEADTIVVKKIERQFRYNALFLTGLSIFIAIMTIFLTYIGIKNTRLASGLVSKDFIGSVRRKALTEKFSIPGEMASSRWKILPGHIPVFSERETAVKKDMEEL